MKKTKVGIIGTGKVGTDLLIKILKSELLECVIFSGIRKESPGIAFAKSLKVNTSTESIKAILKSDAEIIFDATSAEIHKKYFPIKNRFVIDLTPAKMGLMCVPSLNLDEALKSSEVSLISCGAQVMLPKIAGVKNLKNAEYIEVVTTISSVSAGIGTRDNMSEYLETTAMSIGKFFGIPAKSIFIINPAEPPIDMFNTIYIKFKNKNQPEVIQFEIKGNGDYLKEWEGNLDIINKTAVEVAEAYAKN